MEIWGRVSGNREKWGTAEFKLTCINTFEVMGLTAVFTDMYSVANLEFGLRGG